MTGCPKQPKKSPDGISMDAKGVEVWDRAANTGRKFSLTGGLKLKPNRASTITE